jgi:hypothetical protein
MNSKSIKMPLDQKKKNKKKKKRERERERDLTYRDNFMFSF